MIRIIALSLLLTGCSIADLKTQIPQAGVVSGTTVAASLACTAAGIPITPCVGVASATGSIVAEQVYPTAEPEPTTVVGGAVALGKELIWAGVFAIFILPLVGGWIGRYLKSPQQRVDEATMKTKLEMYEIATGVKNGSRGD